MALPMLPGYSFPDPTRQDFKKTQTFGFKNGHVINNNKLDTTASYQYDDSDYAELSSLTLLGPGTMTRSAKQEVKIDPYVPPDVKYYKQVLHFTGFWKETIGKEQHDRGATIHYFLEDDTIQVVEPKLPNSGIQQGTLLRRQRIPIDSNFANTAPYQTTLNSSSSPTFSRRSSPTMTRSLPNETGFNKSVKGGVRDPNNYLSSLSNSPPPSRGGASLTRASNAGTSPTNYNTTTTSSPKASKDGSVYFGWQDLGVGIKVVFFGREYQIVDADHFTRDFYHDQGIELRTAYELPSTLTATQVAPNTRLLSHDAKPIEERYRLKKFLDNDRKVLRFYCIWDDNSAGFTERRPFIMHYFLVDDAIELREVIGANSGRDPASTFMKKQKLPKKPTSLSEMRTAENYTDADLQIGSTINVFGRIFLIYDADPSTRRYYMENFGITEFPHVQVTEQAREVVKRDIPEYTGIGSEEDSLANCLSLMPKAPKKIPKAIKHAASDVMRFTAQLEGGMKGDEERRFTVSFFLEDDTFNVFESAVRGIRGGKFMERKKLKNPRTGVFYEPLEFYVGALIDMNAHKFRLIEGDLFACQYFQDHEDEYQEAALARVVDDVRVASAALKPGMLRRALASTPTASPSTFRQGLNKAGLNLDDVTFSSLCRYYTSSASDVIEVASFLRAMEI